MVTHSSILAWRIPWTEELGGLQSTGHKESDMTERLHFLQECIQCKGRQLVLFTALSPVPSAVWNIAKSF